MVKKWLVTIFLSVNLFFLSYSQIDQPKKGVSFCDSCSFVFSKAISFSEHKLFKWDGVGKCDSVNFGYTYKAPFEKKYSNFFPIGLSENQIMFSYAIIDGNKTGIYKLDLKTNQDILLKTIPYNLRTDSWFFETDKESNLYINIIDQQFAKLLVINLKTLTEVKYDISKISSRITGNLSNISVDNNLLLVSGADVDSLHGWEWFSYSTLYNLKKEKLLGYKEYLHASSAPFGKMVSILSDSLIITITNKKENMSTHLSITSAVSKKEILSYKIGDFMEPRSISTCVKNGGLLIALTYNDYSRERNVGLTEGDFQAEITLIPFDLAIFSISLKNKTVTELAIK